MQFPSVYFKCCSLIVDILRFLSVHRFVSWGNCMRNLLGLGAAVVCGYCGRAPPPPTGTAARLCLETRPRPPHRSLRHPPHGWGLVSCWRAPTLPHVRYKILPAQLLGGDNGTKLSLHIEKAPNRAISGEQGEFSTGSGAVRLVLGEFCTAHAVGRGVLGEFCTGSGPPLGPVAGLSRSWALGRGLPDPQVRSTTVAGGGFALHEALNRRVAGVSHPLVVQFPPSRGLPDERGTQNADHLGEKH